MPASRMGQANGAEHVVNKVPRRTDSEMIKAYFNVDTEMECVSLEMKFVPSFTKCKIQIEENCNTNSPRNMSWKGDSTNPDAKFSPYE